MKERESPSLIPWLVNQSRTLKGWIVFFSAILVLFNLYFLGIGLVTSYQMKGIFMVLCYILIYLTSMPKKRKRLPRVLHTITLLMALVGPLWVMGFENQLVARYYMAGPYDFYAFAICLVGLAALTLRTAAGIVAVILMAGATAYMFLGQYIPGIYGHGVLPLPWITTTLFTSINTGMFGSMSEMGARLISIFMVFASLLIISGLGEFFVGVAQGLFGRMTGGPAKVAVVNSALFGMISGSAVANVSATGSFTIPLMKQVGYSPIAAASIEATASIGGSLMPPIMGLAAFLMAEIVGVSYAHICVLAIIPAMFWYFCLFLNVHYTALRSRVPRWSPPLEQTKQTLKDTWHVALSIPVLIVAKGPALHGLFRNGEGNHPLSFRIGRRGQNRHLQGIEGHPGIALGHGAQVIPGVRGERTMPIPKTFLLIHQGPVEDFPDFFAGELPQGQDFATGQ